MEYKIHKINDNVYTMVVYCSIKVQTMTLTVMVILYIDCFDKLETHRDRP
jgi:hypothetical protein